MTTLRPGRHDDIWNTEKGTYRRCATQGRMTAKASCPKCGKSASLSDHTIAADGVVSPSLVCPYDGCDFHDYVQLEGWKP